MSRTTQPTLSSFDPAAGLELEMVVAHAATGRSLAVEHYFPAVQRRLHATGLGAQAVELDGRCVALLTGDVEYGLDNGYNLLENSTRPVRRSEGGLLALQDVAQRSLALTLGALEADNACVLNASQHPDCPRDKGWYRQVCVARPIYRELVGHRGWHHWEGIDGKAQNGANVGVTAGDAVRALNVMIGLAAVHVALFANSPLESGRETGLKETRLTVWPRIFNGSHFPGDAMLAGWPPRPFVDLGDYFRWMFRPGTVSRSLPLGRRHDYKSAPTVLLDGNPSLSAFLHATSWRGRRTDTGESVVIEPDAAHFEHSQIAQFMDARLRYRLDSLPPLAELMQAWRRRYGLEALFEAHRADIYIEGRCPGAGFPDAALIEEAGDAVAGSMLMSPVALQWGLQQRLGDAERIVARYGWRRLRSLRDRAMRSGPADMDVARLCDEVLEVASAGLSPAEQPLLAYARHVQASRRCAADRMLDSWR
ncbi:MAG: glutamate-cysteine ligase family protein, partial [Burkholderiaceae bacterium]